MMLLATAFVAGVKYSSIKKVHVHDTKIVVSWLVGLLLTTKPLTTENGFMGTHCATMKVT